ncbi:hypothetical protein [Sutterella wadsworthensis]|uniref:hypothetical protein n=1 Tax=Sutterella wadsworthensis TaxID=40545 RepID=UPI0032C0A9B5
MRKVDNGRLVVLAAVFDRLMHQCAFGETVRALKSDGILTAAAQPQIVLSAQWPQRLELRLTG